MNTSWRLPCTIATHPTMTNMAGRILPCLLEKVDDDSARSGSSDTNVECQRRKRPFEACASSPDAHFTAEFSEDKNSILLRIDVPGIPERDLHLSLQESVLCVDGVRRSMSMDGTTCLKKRTYASRYGIDTRIVDVNSISATIELGVLTIRAAKQGGKTCNIIPVTEENETSSDTSSS